MVQQRHGQGIQPTDAKYGMGLGPAAHAAFPALHVNRCFDHPPIDSQDVASNHRCVASSRYCLTLLVPEADRSECLDDLNALG